MASNNERMYFIDGPARGQSMLRESSLSRLAWTTGRRRSPLPARTHFPARTSTGRSPEASVGTCAICASIEGGGFTDAGSGDGSRRRAWCAGRPRTRPSRSSG